MAIATTAGVNPFMPKGVDPAQVYASQVSMNDQINDMNPFGAGDYGLFAQGMSSFGNGITPTIGSPLGFSGGVPGYGGYAGPGSEVMNMTQEQYLEYQDRLNTRAEEYSDKSEDRRIEREVRREHKMKAATFLSEAPEDVVTRQVGLLQRKIKDGDQDHIMDEYTKLTNLVRNQLEESNCKNVPDEQIKAHAEKLYYQITGKNLLDDITEHGDSSFVQGLKQGSILGCLFTDYRTSKSNIAEITDEKINKKEIAANWAGRAIGFGSLLGGILAIAKYLKK